MWDVGGQDKLRPLWRQYFRNADALVKSHLLNLSLDRSLLCFWNLNVWNWMCGELQIYVVDSMDRERIGVAKEEFQAIIRDPLMLNSVILLLANKQDLVIAKSLTNQWTICQWRLVIQQLTCGCMMQKGAMSSSEVCQRLGAYEELKNRRWHCQGASALTGDGLHGGLDWLASTLRDVQTWGTSVRF